MQARATSKIGIIDAYGVDGQKLNITVKLKTQRQDRLKKKNSAENKDSRSAMITECMRELASLEICTIARVILKNCAIHSTGCKEPTFTTVFVRMVAFAVTE